MSLETWKRNPFYRAWTTKGTREAGESNKENRERNSDVCVFVCVPTCEGSVTLSVTTSSLVYLMKRWCSSSSCIFHILSLLSWSKNWKNLMTHTESKPRAGWSKLVNNWISNISTLWNRGLNWLNVNQTKHATLGTYRQRSSHTHIRADMISQLAEQNSQVSFFRLNYLGNYTEYFHCLLIFIEKEINFCENKWQINR